MRQRQRQEAGVVLIITLWVIVILASVSLAFVRQTMIEAKMVGFQRDNTIANAVAKAGLQQAIILLREDKIKDSGEDMSETLTRFDDDDIYQYDGGTEAWADNPELYLDVPFYEMGDNAAYYYVSVEDEASKFPLNNMSTTVDMIAHLLELSGVKERDSMSLAGAIVDWRDKDDVPADLSGGNSAGGGGNRGGGGSSSGQGDEFSHYNSGRSGRGKRGQQEIPQISIKNAQFSSIDELLLLPGMTPAIVFGTIDPDEMQSGRTRRRRMGKGEYLGLKNLVTVYDTHVNMNTVKQEVLESLLYPTLGKDAEGVAEDWVEYRDGRDRETYTDDDNVLKTVDNHDMDDVHYTEVSSFTDEIWKSLVPRIAKIESRLFVITCFAEYKGIEKGYRVVVDRQFTPWDQMPIFGMDTMNVEDLEQVKMQIRLFEPIYDVSQRIERMM
jgi:uncharacterized membrane protein YgcG